MARPSEFFGSMPRTAVSTTCADERCIIRVNGTERSPPGKPEWKW
jgi:hypothetical protein